MKSRMVYIRLAQPAAWSTAWRRSEGSGEFAEGAGEPEVLGVVDRAGDHRDGVGGEGLGEGGQQVVGGVDPVAAGPEAFGVGGEVRVGEAGGDVMAELEVHLPLDQPVGVVLPDQH